MKITHTEIEISGRPVQIRCTSAALKAIQKRNHPIWVEMELFFSCLIRKRVLFHDRGVPTEAYEAMSGLYVSFRPVVTKVCHSKDLESWPPPLEDLALVNAKPYVPKWLTIDFRRAQWHGEFGYTN